MAKTADIDIVVSAPSLVHQKWNNVMIDVASLGKHERAQAGQAGFNFRGIDAVMNAVGPALRAHGVTIVPNVISMQREEFNSKNGGRMVGTIVHVGYKVMAEDGSSFYGSAYGEAADSGDKSTPKAMSVAFRTFLLQALTLPTDEPDPDTFTHERAVGEPTQEPETTGPPIEPGTVDAITDLFETLGLAPEQQRAGIVASTGRNVPLQGLTEQQGQVVLLRLQRKMQAQQAAPTPEAAEALAARALGATPVEES